MDAVAVGTALAAVLNAPVQPTNNKTGAGSLLRSLMGFPVFLKGRVQSVLTLSGTLIRIVVILHGLKKVFVERHRANAFFHRFTPHSFYDFWDKGLMIKLALVLTTCTDCTFVDRFQ